MALIQTGIIPQLPVEFTCPVSRGRVRCRTGCQRWMQLITWERAPKGGKHKGSSGVAASREQRSLLRPDGEASGDSREQHPSFGRGATGDHRTGFLLADSGAATIISAAATVVQLEGNVACSALGPLPPDLHSRLDAPGRAFEGAHAVDY